MVAGNVEWPDSRAPWKGRGTLELVRVDGKGRGTRGGLQGFWLVGDSYGEMGRAFGCGCHRQVDERGVWGRGLGRRGRWEGSAYRWRIKSRARLRPRPLWSTSRGSTMFKVAWEDPPTPGRRGESQALSPEALHLGGWRLRGASIHVHMTRTSRVEKKMG